MTEACFAMLYNAYFQVFVCVRIISTVVSCTRALKSNALWKASFAQSLPLLLSLSLAFGRSFPHWFFISQFSAHVVRFFSHVSPDTHVLLHTHISSYLHGCMLAVCKELHLLCVHVRACICIVILCLLWTAAIAAAAARMRSERTDATCNKYTFYYTQK